MATSNPLIGLQDWYARQCDGDWEHSSGLTIETLDNPGWALRVDLTGSDAANRPYERLDIRRSEEDWLICWVENAQFQAACGPRNLIEALAVFLQWAAESDMAQ
jgi:hypothetical protein